VSRQSPDVTEPFQIPFVQEVMPSTQPKTIWCLGLYASASTWAFNAVRMLHEATATPAKTYFFSGPASFAPFALAATHIVKSHEITDPGTAQELGRRAEKIFITIRDPRDAVASMLRHHQHGFEKTLDLVEQTMRLCVRYAGDPRTKLYAYEGRFHEQPETISGFAAHLGLNPSPQAIASIFESLQRKNVDKYIAQMPRMPGILQNRESGDLLDPRTHWHTHHAGRTGEIGRWQHELSTEQARAVQDRLRPMYRFHVEK